MHSETHNEVTKSHARGRGIGISDAVPTRWARHCSPSRAGGNLGLRVSTRHLHKLTVALQNTSGVGSPLACGIFASFSLLHLYMASLSTTCQGRRPSDFSIALCLFLFTGRSLKYDDAGKIFCCFVSFQASSVAGLTTWRHLCCFMLTHIVAASRRQTRGISHKPREYHSHHGARFSSFLTTAAMRRRSPSRSA